MTRAIVFDDHGEPSFVAEYASPEDAQGIVVSSSLSDEEILATWYFSEDQIKVRPRKPSPHHTWDYVSNEWIEESDSLRQELLVMVDMEAEGARARYITRGSGQSLTYDAKYEEAQRYPDNPPFPWLEAEAIALDLTPLEVAASVIEARRQWVEVGICIEKARLGTKKKLKLAVTITEMHNALDDFRSAISPEHLDPLTSLT